MFAVWKYLFLLALLSTYARGKLNFYTVQLIYFGYCYSFNIFKASALWANSFYKSKCPSVCPSVCLSVCPSVCLFSFEVPFNCLFAPTSQSHMSNIFKDSESFRKSNEKKWFQIRTFLLGSGLKLPRKKKLFFANFALINKVETTLPDGLETSGQRMHC